MATVKAHIPKMRERKHTSIGLKDPPRNKHKRRGWKKYRGQGRPG